MSEAMREAFEAWALKRYGNKFSLDEYNEAVLGFGWDAWQAALSGAQKGEAEPYGYLREVDGRVQLSMGAECPPNRSGGMATPWEAVYTAPQPAQVPESAEIALGFIKQALALPSRPLPDPHAHSHEAYARALHEAFCAIRFKLMHAKDALTAAPSGDAKREADVLDEFRKRIAGQLTHAGGAESRRCLHFTLDKVDWFRKTTIKEQAARLRTAGDEGEE